MGIAPLANGVTGILAHAAMLGRTVQTLGFVMTPQVHALNARAGVTVVILARQVQRVTVSACQAMHVLLARPLPLTPCVVLARGVLLALAPVRRAVRVCFRPRLPPPRPLFVSPALRARGAPRPRRPFVHPVAWGSSQRRKAPPPLPCAHPALQAHGATSLWRPPVPLAALVPTLQRLVPLLP